MNEASKNTDEPSLSSGDIQGFIDRCLTPQGVWAACTMMMAHLGEHGTIEHANSLKRTARLVFEQTLDREIAIMDQEGNEKGQSDDT